MVDKKNNINNVMELIKKKPINGKKTKVTIILAIIFMIYCVFILVKLLANPTKTVIVEQGKIYQEESVDGYILRDEVVLDNSEYSSNMTHLKNECEKVAKGEAIYRYALENENEINEKIAELDKQIQEALKNETSFFSSDIIKNIFWESESEFCGIFEKRKRKKSDW